MSDNRQTTDPLAPENLPVDYDDGLELGVPDADVTIPPLVRDPGKREPPAGTPLWRGAQASDFD